MKARTAKENNDQLHLSRIVAIEIVRYVKPDGVIEIAGDRWRIVRGDFATEWKADTVSVSWWADKCDTCSRFEHSFNEL